MAITAVLTTEDSILAGEDHLKVRMMWKKTEVGSVLHPFYPLADL